MKKYIKVFLALFNLCLKFNLEQRWNTIGNIVFVTLNIIVTIFFVNVYFSFADEINGWQKSEIIFLVGAYRTFTALGSALFVRGLTRFQWMIRNGDLDFVLTKPVNSQFLVSFRLMRPYHLISSLVGVIVMFYALTLPGISFTPMSTVLFLVTFFIGNVLIYGLFFMIAVCAIWISNFGSLGSVYEIVGNLFSIPTDFYGKIVSTFLTLVIPIAFGITIPVKLFTGQLPGYYLLFSFLATGIVLYLSTRLWQIALKSYTSASS